MQKEFKLAIGVPLSHHSVPLEFFESFVSMRKPTNHIFLRAGGYMGVAAMRNQIVEAAKQNECTHLLFLDSDHRHHLDTIPKLFSHNLPIVSGLSFMRVPPFEPVMFRGMINDYKTVKEWEYGELIEVDSVGPACMLIDMKVFENIDGPYFEFMKNPDPNVPYDIGEDVVFCNKVKKAGYKIFVDTGLPNKHIGRVEVDEEFFSSWNDQY